MFGIDSILQMLTVFLFLASMASFVLILIYMFSPKTYTKLEEILNINFGSGTILLSSIEGEINVIDDWIFEKRAIFGPILAALSLVNCINLIQLAKFG
ncbi:MAG: hypothetical protein V1674_06685 [Candidatus Omnitrophota bacterium]